MYLQRCKGELRSQFQVLQNVLHTTLSPQGDRIAAKATSGQIALYTMTGDLLLDCKNQKEGEGCCPIWTSDGTQLIDGSWNGRIYRRNATTGEILAEGFSHMVRSVCVLPDGRLASTQTICGSEPSEYLEFRDPLTLSQPNHRIEFGGHRLQSKISPDARFACAVRNYPDCFHFDLLDLDLPPVSTFKMEESGHAIAFSPNSKEMTIVTRRETIVRLKLPSLEEIAAYKLKIPRAACYSPRGDRLALGGWRNGLLIEI